MKKFEIKAIICPECRKENLVKRIETDIGTQLEMTCQYCGSWMIKINSIENAPID